MSSKNRKVDKGIEFNYWNLSYRRKFIRTLWLTPVFMALVAVVYYGTKNVIESAVIAIVIFGGQIVQLGYTFYKWKNQNR